MTAYFLDGNYTVKAEATTESETRRIVDDLLTQELEAASLDLVVSYEGQGNFVTVGEYVYTPEYGLFQIITLETDYIEKTLTIHAEDTFLWFYSQQIEDGDFGALAEVPQNIEWFLYQWIEYPQLYVYSYKYKLRNSIPDKVRTGDTTASTAKEALQKTAALFDCEIFFSYELENGTLTPYINVVEKRNGQDTNETLTVGQEITELRKTEDCTSIATCVYIKGGLKASKNYDNGNDSMTEDEDLEVDTVVIENNTPYQVLPFVVASSTLEMRDPHTVYKYNGHYYFGDPAGNISDDLQGWETVNGFAIVLEESLVALDDYVVTPLPEYDSGDYVVDTGRVISRQAWARFSAPGIAYTDWGNGAEIAYNADDVETTDPEEVLTQGIAILNEHKYPVVTYECECNKRVTLGASYTLVVENEYITARCLSVETSELQGTFKPTFGNYTQKLNAFETMAANIKGG